MIYLKSQWSAPTSAKDEKTQKATLIRKRFLFHVVDVWKNNKPRESSHENILTILHDKKDTFPNGVKWLIAFLLLARVLLFNDSSRFWNFWARSYCSCQRTIHFEASQIINYLIFDIRLEKLLNSISL